MLLKVDNKKKTKIPIRASQTNSNIFIIKKRYGIKNKISLVKIKIRCVGKVFSEHFLSKKALNKFKESGISLLPPI